MDFDHETNNQRKVAADDSPDGDSAELKLQKTDAATTSQLSFRSDSGKVPLPLPDQDRETIELIKSKKAKRSRISILEAMLGISFVCLVLALTNWMPLPVLTLCLGCTAVVVMLGFFDFLLGTRYRSGITWLLIVSYLLGATISLLRY